MEVLLPFSLPGIVLMFTGAFILGPVKAWIKSIDMLNVTIIAFVFGGKASAGEVLLLLCVANICSRTI